MHAPRESRLEAVIRILRYLQSSLKNGLFFMRNNHLHVETYIDSDYGSFVIDMRSTSGYRTFVGGDNLVTWRSKKQTVVARLSVEAEFCAMTQGAYELLWIKIILTELRLTPSESETLL